MTVKCFSATNEIVHSQKLRKTQNLAIRGTACSAVRRRDFLAASITGAATWLSYPNSALCKPPVVIETESNPGERQLSLTATGIKFSELKQGSGEKVKSGDLVLIELVGKTENGDVFIDTRAAGNPLAFQVGQTNKYITEGLTQVVETMAGGDLKLAVVPAYLGYGSAGMTLPQGGVPPGSRLFYEVELLRCQNFTLGLACCSEESFPCIGKDAQQQSEEAQKPDDSSASKLS
ncbi:hypothetical protein CEUSTIGMA_g1247.t1 [Chlamydomonas eustigma]|uniref:peptidylprolyl isomerase n=1 Tax=Chlamydomonas eustigma TaxID=1157962 RepID=A0A250WSS6_9CHLO|nr:hypothetical protein CEUSTIGMA_g1247.t1 [Chlamydomonas eustigma]|eukprot:GAX73796.1 hypothetical protein CEUSTIGMA_g1247.t1 [Chlamydomonas eustigma]